MSSSSPKVKFILYHYVPSLAAAIIFITLFAILTIAHTYRLVKRRTWFCIPFALGGLFEMAGYVGRALGHKDKTASNPYIMQSVLILVAPGLFAASIYMTLGRLIRATQGEKHSIIRVTWLTKFFVIGDVLSFFVQGGGGGIMSSGNVDDVKLGQNIILAGLFIQIVMFGLFIAASIIFHTRIRKHPTRESCNTHVAWEKMLYVLYAVSCTIMTRNIVRVIEYIEGRDGYLLSTEWPIYVFDASIMASTMAIFFWWYPTMIKPRGIYHMDSLETSPIRDLEASKVYGEPSERKGYPSDA